MDFLFTGVEWLLNNALPFIIVLSVLVFIHEYGHYIVARWNKVGIEAFAIGFGPEIFGWNDKHGTRWKVCILPLGGYVKMYGDMDPASMGKADDLSAEEQAKAFHHKPLLARASIVFAGPAANFLFAIVAFAALIGVVGEPRQIASIGSVEAESAAESAGLQKGDLIVSIQGKEIQLFEEMSQVVRANPEVPLVFGVARDNTTVQLTVTPKAVEVAGADGSAQRIGMLGVRSGVREYTPVNPLSAVWMGIERTYFVSAQTLIAVGEMISGDRDSKELGGPLRIAQMSAEMAEGGIIPLVSFMAVISISLGLINLFPIPILDGGHLVFYALEAIRGRPLGEKAQEYGFRIGAVLVFSLIIFATWNDISNFIQG